MHLAARTDSVRLIANVRSTMNPLEEQVGDIILPVSDGLWVVSTRILPPDGEGNRVYTPGLQTHSSDSLRNLVLNRPLANRDFAAGAEVFKNLYSSSAYGEAVEAYVHGILNNLELWRVDA